MRFLLLSLLVAIAAALTTDAHGRDKLPNVPNPSSMPQWELRVSEPPDRWVDSATIDLEHLAIKSAGYRFALNTANTAGEINRAIKLAVGGPGGFRNYDIIVHRNAYDYQGRHLDAGYVSIWVKEKKKVWV